eukprot:scaffold13215_cov61-Cyclotella_meneghiniana.AAC.4
MNDENQPNSIVEARISKLKKRRRPVNNDNAKNAKEKLGTIRSSSASHSSDILLSCNSKESSDENNGGKALLGFVNCMNQAEVQSIASSIMGDDVIQYSKTEFHQALNRSFNYRFGDNHESHNEQNNENKQQREFHHPLLGIICVSLDNNSSVKETHGDLTIEFPHSQERVDGINADECFDSIHQAKRSINLATGNGMRIPWSFCQFPYSSKVKPKATREVSDHYLEETIETVDLMTEQHSNRDDVHYPHLGKIRIESHRGASIRDAFCIDDAHVLGKLKFGDERFYLDKRLLPPPPISADDSEEECVEVVRYKIVLEEDDLTNVCLTDRNGKGRLIGWISDRGRCADDTYTILCELSK